MEEGKLGTGWSFPLTFNKQENKVETVADYDDIRQSLEILFSTRPGERIIAPNYGCDLRQYAFEPINQQLINNVRQTITASIINFERRINLLNVEIVPETGNNGQMLSINLTYQVRTTEELDNFSVTVPME